MSPGGIIIDKEMGGVSLQDPSQGLLVREWTVQLENEDVVLYPTDTPSNRTVLVSAADITEISLSFDQNMNWALAYVVGGIAKLNWFDASITQRVTLSFGAEMLSPRMTLDDKRAGAVLGNYSDILLFYNKLISGTYWLCYRQQRDRFQTERQLTSFVPLHLPDPPAILRVGMNQGYRIQVEIY